VTKTDLVGRLTALLEPVAADHGYELVAVEQAGGKGTPIIRVLLDREDGLTLDAIAAANEWVSEVLDAEDPVKGPYTLEVSSPGVDRPLVKRADFDRYAGESVNVKVVAGEKRRSWHGVLLGMEGDNVVLEVEGERVEIAYETVQKARLKGVVDFGREGEQSR
jgi:ribosome maturation factor RimP